MNRAIAVLDAPSNLGLRPPAHGKIPGVYRLADALRQQGIVARLGAYDAGRVPAPSYQDARDPETGYRNGRGIHDYTIALADRLLAQLSQGAFPLVLGGDCSILLGAMLALKRLGAFGLMFVDGHNDYCLPLHPEQFPAFAAAGLDLALVTGHGPEALTNIEGAAPYVRENHVALLGCWNDPRDAEWFALDTLFASAIHLFDVERVRRDGADHIARQALAALSQEGIERFWIHLDADVLDQTVMPAVDSPNEHGLTYRELIDLVSALIATRRAVGMEVTILDPDLDPDGRYAAAFADALVAMLPTSHPA
jgi:arginase